MADDKPGYCRPPKNHQFQKGKSGNPRGRPKKKVPPPADNSDAAILRRIDAEIVNVSGKPMTKREVELRLLSAKALEGDLRAIKMLDEKRISLKLDQPRRPGGVLVVPAAPPKEELERRTAENQAKYRTKAYTTLGLTPDPGKKLP